MKNPAAEKCEMFRRQAGWILRRPPERVSREEREWLPWAQQRVQELEGGAAPCPAALPAGGGAAAAAVFPSCTKSLNLNKHEPG